MSTSFAEALVDRCPDLAARAPEESVVERVTDAVWCARAAEQVSEETVTALTKIRRLPQAPSARAGATIWATGERVAASSAALRNGVAVRLLDLNDTYVARAIVHPSDLVPALVATAEDERQSWEQLLGGVELAYEVTCRLAEVVDLRAHGFEAATLSPVATALAASWIAGVDRVVSVEAVRLAALDAATLGCTRHGALSDWKGMSSAYGAVKGLFALELARAGITAPAGVFESPAGFLERITGSVAIPADATSRLRRALYKHYPAQIFVQTPLILLEALITDGALRPDLVDRVVVHLAAVPVRIVGAEGESGLAGLTRESADHSLRFCLAAMLRYGGLTAHEVTAALRDSDVDALMTRIDVVEDEGYTATYPSQLDTRMEAALVDGRTLVVQGAATEHLSRPAPGVQATQVEWPFSLSSATSVPRNGQTDQAGCTRFDDEERTP